MSETNNGWTVEVFIEAENTLGEGPIWWRSRNLLAWVDILECSIHTATWSGVPVDTFKMPEPVGCIFEMPDGSLIAGCQSGLRTVPNGELVARTPDASPDMRINDGKVDPWGNLVFGTMGFPEPREGVGTLWRWDGYRFSQLLEGLTIPNGMDWTNSGVEFLFIDTPTREVRRYPYPSPPDRLGLTNRVLDLSNFKGLPDGLCCANGKTFIAMWDGASVILTTDLADPISIKIPTQRPTSIVPNPSNDGLIVTSASLSVQTGGALYQLRAAKDKTNEPVRD